LKQKKKEERAGGVKRGEQGGKGKREEREGDEDRE
jgi:hypothetical protein